MFHAVYKIYYVYIQSIKNSYFYIDSCTTVFVKKNPHSIQRAQLIFQEAGFTVYSI